MLFALLLLLSANPIGLALEPKEVVHTPAAQLVHDLKERGLLGCCQH